MDLFRERLACAIKQSGLSQRKISASIGKSPGYLTNVLNGNSTPSIEVISTLCHLLKVSPNYLCGYDHGLFLKTSEKAFEEPAERIIGELMQVVAARLESNEPTFEDILFWLESKQGVIGNMPSFDKYIVLHDIPKSRDQTINAVKIGENSLTAKMFQTTSPDNFYKWMKSLPEKVNQQLKISYKNVAETDPKLSLEKLTFRSEQNAELVTVKYIRLLYPVTDGVGNKYILNFSKALP